MGKVAVLGGGGTGCFLAAELSLRGFPVSLYEEKEYWKENIDGIWNGIKLIGDGPKGTVKINEITDDLERAVDSAELILISMVAWRHAKLARDLKPLLRDGMVMIFSAGNFGSILFQREFGNEKDIVVGETSGNMFSCRMLKNGVGISAGPYKTKAIAAFPAKDTGRLAERFSKYYTCREAKNVFETALNAPNIVIHLAGVLLNAGSVERHPDFALYRDGLSKGVIRCQKQVELEKKKIMDALGYEMVVHTDHMERLVQYDNFPELDTFRGLAGPSSLQHRYITEDAAVGDAILSQLGNVLGIETPTLNALIQIAGAVNGTDYFTHCLKLDDLGVTGKEAEEINYYLQYGIPK